MTEVHEYVFDRRRAAIVIVLVAGPVLALVNVFFEPVDFYPDAGFFLSVVLAIVATAALHELAHALAAKAAGQYPIYHFSWRFVYITFAPGTRIPAVRFKAIAAAPLFVLSPVFALLYASGFWETFAYVALVLNVLGSYGDIATLVALRRYGRGDFVEDTRTGFAVFRAPTTKG